MYPVSCRALSFSQLQPRMSIILTRTQLVLLSISNVREAVLCLPRFWASEHGADYRCITYERSGTVATHDCAHITRMSVDSCLPSGVEEDSDSASDAAVVWARSVRGVWGLAKRFCQWEIAFHTTPNRQFPGLFVVHMPFCMFCSMPRVLCFPLGGGG